MGIGTICLIIAVVLFTLVAGKVIGPTIEGVEAIPAGLAFFAASFFPFGVIAISRNETKG